jgi:bla regulator protein blaR1
MHVLIAIALKSVIVAGAALGLLAIMKNRSAAERSWVAHIGLLALVLLACAPLALPSWTVEAPALLGQAPAPEIQAPVATGTDSTPAATLPASTATAAAESPAISLSAGAVATAAYALPAAILLLITLLALMRLITLRARADVLVDGHWLSALARAQRRMGFKHGTALLTSDELASPISWGLMRPVILLNSRAVEAAGEAEAIIAHELAHVARFDWIKLLLARIATALFWFNPLVWILAREAHQLREEAADDAVLAANIADTDYAQLLVGVARHECSGLLLGAHGVAPSKNSLARRVARVLDGASPRGPAARSFALGVFAGAIVVAAPLAALTLTPAGARQAEQQRIASSSNAASSADASGYYPGSGTPTDLPSIIADGVSTSVATAVAAVGPVKLALAEGGSGNPADNADLADIETRAPNGATVTRKGGVLVSRAPSGATVTMYPPDANGRQKIVAVAPNGATSTTYADTREARAHKHRDSAIDRAIEMKAVGVTPEYVSEMIAAAPHLARLDPSEFVGMRAVGVSPAFTREWVSAGFRSISADQLTEARAVGLSGSYVRKMMDAGVRASFDDYVQLRAVGVSPDYVRSLRQSGYVFRNVDQLVEMRALGISARDLKGMVPAPPAPPKPARPPAHNWDPHSDRDSSSDDG